MIFDRQTFRCLTFSKNNVWSTQFWSRHLVSRQLAKMCLVMLYMLTNCLSVKWLLTKRHRTIKFVKCLLKFSIFGFLVPSHMVKNHLNNRHLISQDLFTADKTNGCQSTGFWPKVIESLSFVKCLKNWLYCILMSSGQKHFSDRHLVNSKSIDRLSYLVNILLSDPIKLFWIKFTYSFC